MGVLWPQLSKVLKVVCWAGSVTHDKGLVYPTVAYALSGVVVSEASPFVALMVSYLLPIFFLTNDFCIVFSGGFRYPESILH